MTIIKRPFRVYNSWKLTDLATIPKNGLTVFSCFHCGGGSSMGYKLAGFNVLGGVELDPEIMSIYRANHYPKHSYLMGVQQFNEIPLNDLPNELKNLDLMQIGKDIISGLILGISSMASKVGDTINKMAEKVKQGFKDAMGIKSPSKVFEMFGKYTAEGYQQGVEGQTVQTAQATAGMASSATAGAVSVTQSNAININGSQNPNLIMQEVKKFLATQNNLAFNGVL